MVEGTTGRCLKDAIKYRIRQCLEENFSVEGKKELHPAAGLIPFVKEGVDGETDWNGMALMARSGMLAPVQVGSGEEGQAVNEGQEEAKADEEAAVVAT